MSQNLAYSQQLNNSENTKVMVHINMGVSQILHMHINSLINMAFNIIIMKNQNMLKINNMKACKVNGSQRQLSKPLGQISRSPKHDGPSTKLSLKVMHPKLSPFSSERTHHQGTNTLTSSEIPHLYQLQQGWLLVSIPYWVHGGQHIS